MKKTLIILLSVFLIVGLFVSCKPEPEPTPDVKYNVTFDVQGHGTAPATQQISEGGNVTKPTDPSATGYKFLGWYKEAACTNEWNFTNDTVTADKTLYAKWVETKTVSEILGTVNSFPTSTASTAPGNAWKTGDGKTCFILSLFSNLMFKNGGSNTSIELNTDLEKNAEGNYVYSSDTLTITFVMSDNVLTAITRDHIEMTEFNGTYTPAYTVTFATSEHGAVYDAATSGQKVTSISVVSGTAVSTDGNKITIGDKDYYAVADSGYKFKEFSGTVPATITEATTITPVFEKTITIADILATVDGGFPTSEATGWRTSKGQKSYIDDVGGKKYFCLKPNGKTGTAYYVTDEVARSGDNYTANGGTCLFTMQNGKLVSITVQNSSDDYNGTYTPAATMPVKSDIIQINGKDYRVLSIDGSNAFVMSMDNVAASYIKYDEDGTTDVTTGLLAYAGSDIDEYLEKTWYAGLDSTMKDAIKATTIDQPAYRWKISQPGSGTYYAGTSGFGKSPSNYYIVPDGDKTATVGSRHAYLLDVMDVVAYLGEGNLTPANVNEMFFDTDSSKSNYCWLRSADADRSSYAEIVYGILGALNYSNSNDTCEARAAFTIDLSQVTFTIKK